MTFLNETKPTIEEALAHFGKRGMKWGVRNAAKKVVVGSPDASGVTRKDVRKSARAGVRKTRRESEDWDDFTPGKIKDGDIKAARQGLRQANADYKTAKSTYKSDKSRIGKNAAKIALNKAGEERSAVLFKSESNTRGEKAVVAAIAVGQVIAKNMADKKAAAERVAQENDNLA